VCVAFFFSSSRQGKNYGDSNSYSIWLDCCKKLRNAGSSESCISDGRTVTIRRVMVLCCGVDAGVLTWLELLAADKML